jgi:hypothetical protein
MVRDALHARAVSAAASAGAGTGAGPGSKIFKATEMPVWEKLEQFNQYYASLRFAMRGAVVTNDMCQQACFRILSLWRGEKLMRYAQEVDASDLARGTWEETQTNILEWLNRKFRSKTDFATATRTWETVATRLAEKKIKSANEMFLEFETELHDYQAACHRAGVAVPNQREITSKFIASLPPTISSRVRENANDFDTVAYGTYRTQVSMAWEASKISGVRINAVIAEEVGPAVKRAFAEVDQDWDEADARAVTRNGKFFPRTKNIPCRESWEKAPPKFQGTIITQPWMGRAEKEEVKERYKRVKEANVCARCRLPKNPTHLVNTFVPVGPMEGNRVSVSEVEADEALQEDIAQQD